MRRYALQVMAMLFLSKVLGLVREVALSYFYGASATSDAYITATYVPTLLYTLVGAALSYVLLPVYTRIKIKSGAEDSHRFLGSMLTIVVIILSLIALLMFIFAPQIVTVIAIGYEGAKRELTIGFLRIVSASILFFGLTQFHSSFLQAEERFATSNFPTVPGNIVIIATIVISSLYPEHIYILPIGFLLSKVVEWVVLLPPARKLGFRLKLRSPRESKDALTVPAMMLPIFIGTSVDQINALIDKSIASVFSDGAVSALSYASILKSAAEGIIIAGIVSVTFTKLSQMAAQGDLESVRDEFVRNLITVQVFMVPIGIFSMVFGQEIVEFVYQRGAFDAEAATLTTASLIFYSVGLLASGIRVITFRTFYAMGENWKPMFNSVLMVVINVVLNLILSRFIGVPGLALASSLSVVIGSITLLITLYRYLERYDVKHMLISLLKIAASTLITAVPLMYINSALLMDMSALMRILIGGAVGAVIYVACAYVLGVPGVRGSIDQIGRKFLHR